MISQPLIEHRVVKNGVAVPREGSVLPEGADVTILIASENLPEELQLEFDAWESASDEAWAMIDRWETEDTHSRSAHGTGGQLSNILYRTSWQHLSHH